MQLLQVVSHVLHRSTCINTTSTCTSCEDGTSLYLYNCLQSCPSGYYSISKQCLECKNNCTTCSSKIYCISCTAPLLLSENACIQECPIDHSVIINNVCTACNNGCANCSQSNKCFECKILYYLIDSVCYSSCPQGYQLQQQQCVTVEEIVNATIIKTLTSQASSFPLPFTIVGILIQIACMMSKLQNGYTYIIGVFYAFYGLIETICLIYTTLLCYNIDPSQTVRLILLVSSIGLIYLLNLLSLTIQTPLLLSDKQIQIWFGDKSHCVNKFIFYFITALSAIINYKLKMIIFSKLFVFACMRAQLEMIQKFKIFNIFSFVGFLAEGVIIYACIIAIISIGHYHSLFFPFIDLLLIAIINAVLVLAVSKKDEDFFQEQIDGLKQIKDFNYKGATDGEMFHWYKNGFESNDAINQDFLLDQNSIIQSNSLTKNNQIKTPEIDVFFNEEPQSNIVILQKENISKQKKVQLVNQVKEDEQNDQEKEEEEIKEKNKEQQKKEQKNEEDNMNNSQDNAQISQLSYSLQTGSAKIIQNKKQDLQNDEIYTVLNKNKNNQYIDNSASQYNQNRFNQQNNNKNKINKNYL